MQIVHKVINHIKNSLDQGLVGRIEILEYYLKHYDINHKKQCILLVGKEREIALVEGIVSYMFYVLQNDEIRYLAAGKNLKWRGITLEDFTSLNEQDTEKKLFGQECMSNKEIQRYGRGLLFLRNLNCGYKRLLERLTHVIRTNYLPGTDLIFVVSTNKTGDLPQEFSDLFEIIRLEPEEQSKALDTLQAKPESDYVFIYRNNCLSYNGLSMKLSSKRNKLLIALKKPKTIRCVLKMFYDESVPRDEKIIDNKRASFDSFVCKFNKAWRDRFSLNRESELIKCENKYVSIVQKIKW